MINICLCDDNTETLREYAGRLEEISARHSIPVQIFSYTSGEQLICEAEDQLRSYDIVYMDMLMRKLDGIQTAKKMREIDFEGKIIFLTSSRDHALESFDVSPLHYIVKQETSHQRFEEIFLKAVNLIRDFQKDWFVFENRRCKTRVLLEDILYFEADRRQVSLHTRQEVYQFYSKIDQVEKQLVQRCFARCHRSFVVNLKYICSLSPTELTLTGNITLPLGSTYLKNIKLQFSKFLESKSVLL